MAGLASIGDMEARLGRELETDQQVARVEALLADASAAVRSYTGQQFTRATTTDRLTPPVRGPVVLPQRPVNDVTAVASVLGVAQQFLWDGLNLYVGTYLAGVIINLAEAYYDGGRYYGSNRRQPIDVTYDHGYSVIPGDVVAVVCQMAGRAFGRPLEDSGVQQESIGGYAYTTGVAAAAGGVGMLRDERAVLDAYRRQAGVILTAPRF